MSELKHTPGPWRVDETKDLGAYGVWTDYPTHPGYDGAGYESQICDVIPLGKEISRDQRDANARLIAAAPDLLAACKEFVRVNGFNGYEFDSNEPSLYRMIVDAIAKAEGRTP